MSIFDVNLWKNDPPEDSIFDEGEPCASLVLPAGPYALLDALEKIRLEPGDAPHWRISDYHQVNLLISEQQGSIYELNALAWKLSELDDRQVLAYQGLMELDISKNHRPAPISLLIDMACGTGCCRALPEIRNNDELGRYLVKNGLIPNLEGLPEELREVLDYGKIGYKQSLAEGGIFVKKDFTTTLGYVVQDRKPADAHTGMDLTLRQPDYAILLDVAGGRSGSGGRKIMPLKLPASQETLDNLLAVLGAADWKKTVWEGRDCRVPLLTGKIFDYGSEAGFDGAAMAYLNRLAEHLAGMGPEKLAVCKAFLDAYGCYGIADVEPLMDLLDGYQLTSRAGTPAELAEESLSAALGEEQAQLLTPHLDLDEYGQALIGHRGGVLTAYGLLERKDS